MRPLKKQKLTRQEYLGKKYWKIVRTYLKNRGISTTKKECIKLV